MARIEVTNLDRWVQRFLRGKRYRFRLEFDRDKQSWHETQDMSASAWRLIRSIVPRCRDDIFIFGDAHQRIYPRHRVVLGRCDIEIRSRGRKLRLNYRTTEQTRRWASGVLARRSIDDLDGGEDDNKGIHSVTRGPEPRIRHFENLDGQATWLVG